MPLQFPEYIEKLKPYVAGKPIDETKRELGLTHVIKLASNENPLGPSPRAVKAMSNGMKTLALYPDPAGYELRNKLKKREKVEFDNIVLGNGSNEIMELILKSYTQPGDFMVAGSGVFAAFPISARIQGVETLFAPPQLDMSFNLEAMLDLVKKNTRVRVVALPNPNNPTGVAVSDDDLDKFLQEVERVRDGSVHVILDYAYYEFVDPRKIKNPIHWFKKFSNVSVLKTFSKIFGLGGLRIGYGVLPAELAARAQKVRMPFNVSTLGLIGASAALDDHLFVKKTLQLNREQMKVMSKFYQSRGIPQLPSQGNFILIHTQKGVGMWGQQLFEHALRQGVITRPVANYGLPEWLRVSLGKPSENKVWMKVIDEVLKQQRGKQVSKS